MNKPDEKTLREKIRKGLSTIKVQLGLNMPSTPSTPGNTGGAPQACAAGNYTLDDGTLIKVSGPLDVNSAVQVVTPQGTAPIPDGEYTLRDANGKQVCITTISGSITNVETPTQQNDSTVLAAQQILLKQTLARVDKLEAENKSYSQSFKQLLDLIELVVQQPAQPATEHPLNSGWTGKKGKPNPLQIIKMLKAGS